MTHTNSPARFSGWLRHALANIPFLYRVNIHRRLTLCFVFVIVLMLVGNGVLLWQLHLIRVQVERLNGVNEELIEVLRVHTGLLSVYERLGVLARSEDSARLLKESATLRKGLLDDAQRTLAAFNHLPPEMKVDQTVLPTLESIERTLPSHLDAITAAAASGEWDAVRFRIERQVQPLESLSSELVKDVTREVEEQRAQAALNISRAEGRIFLAVPITGFVTLLIAAGLGVAITRSITEPLGRVVEGSKALARGEFEHQISVIGADELAHLGLVFNDTARKLRDLYEDLRGREEKLRRSEAYLAEAQKLAKTGSWAYNPAAEKCIYWSDEMLRIFGLELQTINLPDREEFLRLVHPEDRDRFNERIDKAFREKADFVQDYRIVLTNGTVKHIHGIGHPVLDETGNIIEYVGTDVDVTERKRAEEALQRSEGYLAEAQKLTHTGSWAVRVPEKENVYWSTEMYRIFGLDPAPTPPSYMEVARRLHPEDAPYHPRVVERAIRDRSDFEIDYRLLLPNGAAKYIHVVGHPVLNASDDVIELVGTAMDVTEQHEARAALETAFEQIKAEETELRRMTDAIATNIYVLRPDGTALFANQTVLDYTGLTLEDVQREDQRARVFHPEDLERLRVERHDALARGEPFELEQRALRKDGNYRWFLVRYNPLRDDHGNIIRWYATATDIEDRKQAEERMRDENVALREQIDQAFMFEDIVGSSPALQTVLSSIVKVAPTDSTVLITGETGTGKELIARAIHKHSQRSGQAFISVNCASIPSSLIASELFGHEKGAFTGAVQRRQGRFELAHSGTIFLDEVGDVPAETQIALLRVLQERQFERVGGNRILTTDVRVIAATNRDLTAAIDAGTFRSDLFYRLNVFPIEVPPLRKRKEDIPMLVEYFVKRYAEKAGKQICKIDNNTLELCQSYPWPGNIRELQNIVERSVILSSGDTFCIEKAWLARPEPARQELPGPLPDTLQNQEKEIIETALAECKGKVAGPGGAAAKLGIPRSTLDSKIKQLNIKKYKFISEQ
jgi:PAS domain S-box-containing protein